MKSNNMITLAAALAAVALPGLSGQEAPPAGVVPDAMEERPASPAEEQGPRLTDVDRLFEAPQEEGNSSADDEQSGAAALNESFASPSNQEMMLDASDLITVDYPNEEIRTVLRNVADLYMLNLVVPDTLVGTTSIKLRDVTWRQIYSVVLEPVGYTFIEEGSIIKVVSLDALNVEPPVTEIFMVNYADASSIGKTVETLVSSAAGGVVRIDKRSNALIVSERASKMDSIRTVIERLDKPTQQVFIETRFIEVTDTDVKNIGVNWASLREYGVSAGQLQTEYDRFSRGERGNSDTDDYNNGTFTVSQGGTSIGTLGNLRGRAVDNLTGQTITDVSTFGSKNLATAAFNSLKNITNGRATSAVFSADEFGFIIGALKEQGGSRLVSNPTIVTLNNQEAMISVGEQFPIPSYQYNEETGGFEVSGFDFKDIGIILKVTPSVNHTGLINLSVVPEVSSRTGTVDFGGASGASIPIISTRRTETQIALKDGFTMGIGGLMESSGSENNNRVPVLGKVPGLGRLFKHESKTETKRNLLIFITAKILPSEAADFEDVFSEEMMEAAGVDAVALKNR